MRYVIIAAIMLLAPIEAAEARTSVYSVVRSGRTVIVTGGGRTCYTTFAYAGHVTRSCY